MDKIILFGQVLKIFKSNLKRSILTVLGIMIGVSSVIIVMSVGAGAESLIFEQITSVGSNLISVMPGYAEDEGPPASVMGIEVTTLKNSDIEAVKKINGVHAAAGYTRGIETINWQNQKADITYMGVTSSYVNVEDIEMKDGYFFDESQDKSMVRVAVLGYGIWQELFSGQYAIGERVRIGTENFRVIGVIEKRGIEGFENQDRLVFIPLLSAQKIMLGTSHISLMRIKVHDENLVDAVLQEVKNVLRQQHNIGKNEADDFSARAAKQALSALKQVTTALKLFLSIIAGISLLVGGVGIMNIMLVSVNERTREIGLRKAVGANNNNIGSQFLLEALSLTFLGGVTGVIAGILISAWVALLANYLGYNWNFVISFSSIFAGLVMAGGIGVLFGFYPCFKAAKMEPVDALRYE